MPSACATQGAVLDLLAEVRWAGHTAAMRCAIVVFGLVAAAGSTAAGQDEDRPPQERARLEMFIAGERHFATMIAENPMGGEDRVAARTWTGGLDLCPMAVLERWVHLGGCLGIHVVTSAPATDDTQWLPDSTLAYLGRATLRSTFLAPRYLRGGVDLHYRAYLSPGGRESAVEVGARLGVELKLGNRMTPIIFGLLFRAPVVNTRSDSTYGFPIYRADGTLMGYDARPTRDVRIFTLGLYVGSAWSL